MYYRRRKKKGRLIVAVCSLILFIGLVYGYVTNNNEPLNKPYEGENTPESNIENNKKNSINAKQNTQEQTSQIEETSKEDTNIIESQERDTFNIVNKDTEIIFNTYFKKTGELETKKTKVPITLVGLQLDEFKNYIEENYSNWKIKNISTKSVALFIEKEGFVPNTYIVQNKDGYIVIYKINDSGEKVLYEETDIPISIMSEIDKRKLKEGIVVKNLDEAYKIVEDYSS